MTNIADHLRTHIPLGLMVLKIWSIHKKVHYSTGFTLTGVISLASAEGRITR